MSRRLGRRTGAAFALLTVVLVTIPASPAAAEASITIDSPRAEPPLTSAAVSIGGSASTDAPLLYRISSVRLKVGSATQTVECRAQPCRFSWSLSLPANGPYTLEVTATESILVGGLGSSREASRSFSVAAPPARPVMDKPKVTEDRNVDLSWSRNTEPDMLYYALFRRNPGSSSFTRIGGDIPQKSSGKITFSDTTTSAFIGGEYAYRVLAVRQGASGTADTETPSEPSTFAIAAVPPPPTTSTSPPDASAPDAPVPPGSPTTAAAPTTTVKPGSAAGVDLSGFIASRPAAVPLSPITIPEPPDTGFGAVLPFGARPPGEELEEGPAEAVPPRDRTSIITSLDSGRPLVPVAGGLVLLLLALHMRLLNRRIKAADDADLPVDGSSRRAVPAPAGGAVQPEAPALELQPEAAVEPEPVPAPYDIGEDEDWAPPEEIEPVQAGAAGGASEIDFDLDLDVEPDFDVEPDIEPEFDVDPEPHPDSGPASTQIDEDEIEVFEVVSPAPRRLARAGSR